MVKFEVETLKRELDGKVKARIYNIIDNFCIFIGLFKKTYLKY